MSAPRRSTIGLMAAAAAALSAAGSLTPTEHADRIKPLRKKRRIPDRSKKQYLLKGIRP